MNWHNNNNNNNNDNHNYEFFFFYFANYTKSGKIRILFIVVAEQMNNVFFLRIDNILYEKKEKFCYFNCIFGLNTNKTPPWTRNLGYFVLIKIMKSTVDYYYY